MGRCDGIMRGGKRDLESMRLGFDCKLAGLNNGDFIMIFHICASLSISIEMIDNFAEVLPIGASFLFMLLAFSLMYLLQNSGF